MRARDIMTAPVIAVRPETPVPEVAALLVEHRISGVPVVDETGRAIGIVSEGDLLRRGETRTDRQRSGWLEMLLNRDIQASEFVKEHGACVRDVMTRDVVSVDPDAEIAEIARILERRRIRRVPVVENGVPIGIVSRANVLRALVAYRQSPAGFAATSDPAIARTLEDRLRSERWIDVNRINIVVTDGIVHLWGALDSDEQRRALLVAAEGTPGVKAVQDHLTTDWFTNKTG
jgi:CBS domain-containing protein